MHLQCSSDHGQVAKRVHTCQRCLSMSANSCVPAVSFERASVRGHTQVHARSGLPWQRTLALRGHHRVRCRRRRSMGGALYEWSRLQCEGALCCSICRTPTSRMHVTSAGCVRASGGQMLATRSLTTDAGA